MRARLLAPAVVACLVVGCATDDGRDLRPATMPIDTSVTTTLDPAAVDDATASTALTLSSPSIDDDGSMPVRLSATDGNVSPALSIAGVPDTAVELGLVALANTDAGPEIRWAVAGIDPSTTEIAEGEVPAEATVYLNDLGVAAWSGPDPAPGQTQRFEIRLFAFTDVFFASDGPTPLAAMQSTPTVASATLFGTFAAP